MMNVLALGLVLSSLATGVFFSPPQQQKKIENYERENMVVKEANRVIMVEYERETHPRDSDNQPPPPPSLIGSHDDHHYNPKELICDAYGKCKEKLAGVLGKAKDGVEEVGEKTREILGEAKDHDVGGVGEKAKGAIEKTKDSVLDKAREVEEVGESAMEKTKEWFEKAKEEGKEVRATTMEKTKEGFEKAKKAPKEASEAAMERTKEEIDRAKETVFDEALKLARNFTHLFHTVGRVLDDAAKLALGVILLLGLSTSFGISVWVTFLSSHVLAGILPRQQFGIAQSKIYPVYFKALIGSIGTTLVAHAFRNPHWGLKTVQAYHMIVSLALVLINLLYLEPLATKTMYDQMKLEKEEGRGLTEEEDEFEVEEEVLASIDESMVARHEGSATGTTISEPVAASRIRADEVRSRMMGLNRKLTTLNSISSLLNVLTLMAFTLQLVYLAADLPAPHVH